MPKYESSVIASASYDAATRTLEVEFRNGGVYRYADVPPEEAEAFAAADSKGGFFQAYIRNNFAASRIEEVEPEMEPIAEQGLGSDWNSTTVSLPPGGIMPMVIETGLTQEQIDAVYDEFKNNLDAATYDDTFEPFHFAALLNDVTQLLMGLELTPEQGMKLIDQVRIRIRTKESA